MRITSAEFVTSAVTPEQFPPAVGPEIAFVGRSNVGKSSLLNSLLNRRSLAKTSSTPGKTRIINFFSVNRQLGFVDLPGYGYAQVSRSERNTWGPMIERFFHQREALSGVIQLIDIRHAPSAQDRQQRVWLAQWPLPLLTVATKADKVSRNQRPGHVKQIREALQLDDPGALLLFSAQTGEGKEKVWEWIRQITAV